MPADFCKRDIGVASSTSWASENFDYLEAPGLDESKVPFAFKNYLNSYLLVEVKIS